METIVQSQKIWEQRGLNTRSVRRLKLVSDADLSITTQVPGQSWNINFAQLVPLRSFTGIEFIFPRDISCGLTFQRQISPAGSIFWRQTINFSLPMITEAVMAWIAQHPQTKWIAITEDYNLDIRVLGGEGNGLDLAVNATTGQSKGDANPIGFGLTCDQLHPYHRLGSYDDNVLFPNAAGFSYGFSIGFNS